MVAAVGKKKKRKETAIYKRRNNTQNDKKNTEYTTQNKHTKRENIKSIKNIS